MERPALDPDGHARTFAAHERITALVAAQATHAVYRRQKTETLPLPVYLDCRRRVRSITGKHAATWPHPRVIEIDGSTFIEQPLPSETGWGLTFHAVRPPRTAIGRFRAHYFEGRASGFPWWPVVVFSAKSAARHLRGSLG